MTHRLRTESEPTQVRHPARATIRTVFAAVLGLLPILPTVAHELGIAAVPWVAAVLAVTASITRLMATPAVERWLSDNIPWLTADSPTPRKDLTND